jgi:hypothetical protein
MSEHVRLHVDHRLWAHYVAAWNRRWRAQTARYTTPGAASTLTRADMGDLRSGVHSGPCGPAVLPPLVLEQLPGVGWQAGTC